MRRLGALLVVAALVFVGCSDDEEEGGDKACGTAPAALTGPTNLPANFPIPDEVVVTETKAAGPSTVVTGYAEADLKDVFDSFKDELDKQPYSVTKSEREKDDAEVNFSGESTTGQVRLGEECEGRTSVQITARPG